MQQAEPAATCFLPTHPPPGPGVGGPHGPYRQSERKQLYMKFVGQLVKQGRAYPCFCTDEELAAQRAQAEAQKLPPVYRGPWADATPEQVARAKAEGRPYCYRFRVPKNQVVTINVSGADVGGGGGPGFCESCAGQGWGCGHAMPLPCMVQRVLPGGL